MTGTYDACLRIHRSRQT